MRMIGTNRTVFDIRANQQLTNMISRYKPVLHVFCMCVLISIFPQVAEFSANAVADRGFLVVGWGGVVSDTRDFRRNHIFKTKEWAECGEIHEFLQNELDCSSLK